LNSSHCLYKLNLSWTISEYRNNYYKKYIRPDTSYVLFKILRLGSLITNILFSISQNKKPIHFGCTIIFYYFDISNVRKFVYIPCYVFEQQNCRWTVKMCNFTLIIRLYVYGNIIARQMIVKYLLRDNIWCSRTIYNFKMVLHLYTLYYMTS